MTILGCFDGISLVVVYIVGVSYVELELLRIGGLDVEGGISKDFVDDWGE